LYVFIEWQTIAFLSFLQYPNIKGASVT